jgi:hypothetical protein
MARWGFPAQGRRAARPDLSQPHVMAGTQLGGPFYPNAPTVRAHFLGMGAGGETIEE